MGWLGLDDTDSLKGGCTTAVFFDLLHGLPEQVIVGTPRLVRLWPFARRRTRGNAALAVELHSPDVDTLVEHLDAWWVEHVAPLKGAQQDSTISNRAQHPASPGMVWFNDQPPSAVYFKAVRGELSLEDLPEPTRSWGDYGRIGATAAVAWPGQRCTWEAIAWRSESHSGTSRSVDETALSEVDSWPEVVFSRDPRRGTSLIAPRGSSPVLFGVRATSAKVANKACSTIANGSKTEPIKASMVFQTNQASGDHLGEALELIVESVEVDPSRKHAKVHTNGPDVLAFFEGGPVNSLARWLRGGDVFRVKGLLDHDGNLHAEQMKVQTWLPRKHERPLCPHCPKRLKSMGRGQGLRCPACKFKMEEDAWVAVECTPPWSSWVEPEVGARRHLARPLAWDN